MVDLFVDQQRLISLGEGEARDLAAGLALLGVPRPAPRAAGRREEAGPLAAGQPWSSEQDEELFRRLCEGEDSTTLALHFGRSRSAIWARLLHLGLEADLAAAAGGERVGTRGG